MGQSKPFLRTYTPSEIALMCKVDIVQVTRWIATGKLAVTQSPGSISHVRERELIDFLNRSNIPLPADINQKMQPKKVLIVDDNKMIVRGLTRLFSLDEHYILEFAYDGVAAEAKLRAGTYDVLILDYNMPGFSGEEVVKELFAQGKSPRPHVVIYSGTLKDDQRQRLKDMGVDAIFDKAVEPETLLNYLQRAV
jgi:CheY-like chemotaxis protein